MSAYSTFFSSGLTPSHDILAAYPRPRPRIDSVSSTLSFISSISVSTIKSPVVDEAVDDTSDLENDSGYTKKGDICETITTSQPSKSSPLSKTLRRRKSSLSTNVSPTVMVRSQSKAAENALSFRLRLTRSRSSSVNSVAAASPTTTGSQTPMTGATGTPRVTGRQRSGTLSAILKPARRGFRRAPNNPLPPPSAPLPPVPPSGPRKHSRSISLVPRLLNLSVRQDLLPSIPSTPPTHTQDSGNLFGQ
ncbi:hypothetical protein L218DRAFT_945791 [Marasmius fiardii PR-910]|nr:hypothetical protein L218DRAFT_945791 [Marasmius fiardii PR-910]